MFSTCMSAAEHHDVGVALRDLLKISRHFITSPLFSFLEQALWQYAAVDLCFVRLLLDFYGCPNISHASSM